MPNQNGLDFNFDPPQVIESNSLRGETIGAISDTDGALLFYCDGINVYDRDHNILPNGQNIGKSTSAKNGVIFIPDGSNTDLIHLYVINAQDDREGGTFYYSRIDRSLNNGAGDIIDEYRSITLGEDYVEGMKAIKGDCGVVWIILRKSINKELHAFKLINGNIKDIVVSDILVSDKFPNTDEVPQAGEIDYHAPTAVLAVSNSRGIIELFSFDTSTGVVSNPFVISRGDETPELRQSTSRAYGSIALSPSGSSIIGIENIAGNRGKFVYKYDFDFATKLFSKKLITQYSQGGGTDLSRHPLTGDIWMTRGNSSDYLDKISFENDTCIYQDSVIQLLNPTRINANLFSEVIVPDPIPTLTSPFPIDTLLCPGSNLELSTSNSNVTHVWSTGSTAAQINITAPGIYWLDRTVESCYVRRDSVTVRYAEAPALDLGDMIVTCHTDPITLMSQVAAERYTWSTGEVTPIIEVSQTGSYILEVTTAEGCSYLDTIDIVFDELSLDLGPDQAICIGDSTILSVPSPETLSSIIWSDGSTDDQLVVKEADSYWLRVDRGMCSASDTIMISDGMCDVNIDTMMVDTMMPDSMTTDGGIVIPEDPCHLYIPNTISSSASRPLNRVFQVFSACDLEHVQISIYDRWGNLHYQVSDSVIRDQEVLRQPGVYMAKVEYRFIDMEEPVEILQSLTVL